MGKPVCVLIAEDHPIMRKSLSRLIDAQAEFQVVGNASDGAAAVEMARSLRPDVVLMDYDLPKIDGVEATRQILNSHPLMVVIGFSMYDDGPEEKALLEAGAAGLISKSQSTIELLAAIRKMSGLPSFPN